MASVQRDFVNLVDDDGQVWQRFGVTTQEYYALRDAQWLGCPQGTNDPRIALVILSPIANG